MQFALRGLRILGVSVSLAIRLVALLLAGLITGRSKSWRLTRVGHLLLITFQSLSGAFVKFGQLLSMRADLLPEEITSELQHLLDRVPPEQLERDLDRICRELRIEKLDEVFSRLEEEPLAAASFATVYSATLKTGESVAVKVQRPRIYITVKQDITILKGIARLLDFTGIFRRVRILSIVNEFAEWTEVELDYQREGQHMGHFRRLHGERSDICIPRVFWKYTTARVLVMDQLVGIWVSDILEQKRRGPKLELVNGEQCARIGRIVFSAMMTQVFDDGFFHADPHAGNICLMNDDRVGLIDFGMVGMLRERERQTQLKLLTSVQRGDIEDAFAAIIKMLNVPPDAALVEFRREFEKNVRMWFLLAYQPEVPRKKRSAGILLLANFKAARQCGLSLKSGITAYYRSFLVLDSVISELSGEIDTRVELEAFVTNHIVRADLAVIRDCLDTGGIPPVLRLVGYLNKIPSVVSNVVESVGRTEGMVEASFDSLFGNLATFGRAVAGLCFTLFIIAGLYLGATYLWPHFPTIALLKRLVGIDLAQLRAYIKDVLLIALALGVILRWVALMCWIRAYKIE
jgi:predicted unusual protein kinase regulating ubiquinone biosynthesis (AarF/ABC1/UbiB family)